MRSVGNFIRRFARDASGATAIEYSIVVGMIFLAIVSAVQLFTDNTNAMYNYIEASIKSK